LISIIYAVIDNLLLSRIDFVSLTALGGNFRNSRSQKKGYNTRESGKWLEENDQLLSSLLTFFSRGCIIQWIKQYKSGETSTSSLRCFRVFALPAAGPII